jgi:hypothetical protein
MVLKEYIPSIGSGVSEKDTEITTHKFILEEEVLGREPLKKGYGL